MSAPVQDQLKNFNHIKIVEKIKDGASIWKYELASQGFKQKDEVNQKVSELISICQAKLNEKESKRQREQLRKKEEQKRKREEEQEKKRIQNEKKIHQEKRIQEEKRKKQEQERRRKQQQLKLQKQKEDFKQKAQLVFKRIQDLQKNLQQFKNFDPNLNLQQAIKLITSVKVKINFILQRAKQIQADIQQIQKFGNSIGQKALLHQPLKKLMQKITQQNLRYDDLQNAVYLQDRQKAKQNRKKELQGTYTLPKDAVQYHQSNFYQLQITNLYELELQKLKEKKLQNAKYEQQKQKLQALFKILRIKQRYINQIKILIELQLLKPEILQYHHFDLSKFKELFAKKSKFVNEINQNKKLLDNMQEFNKIQQQLATILSKLNTQEFMVPYRYPTEILAKTKQDLVIEHYNKLAQDLTKNLKEQQQKCQSLQIKKKDLEKQLLLKTDKLQKTKEKYKIFTQNQSKNISEQLLLHQQKDDIIPKQIKEPYKQELNIKITNLNELKQLYAIINDQSKSKEACKAFEEKKTQRKQLQQEFIKQSDKFLRSPMKIEDYLIKTPLPSQFSSHKAEQNNELQKLKKQCEVIEAAKRSKQNKNSAGSKIELYSSIL